MRQKCDTISSEIDEKAVVLATESKEHKAARNKLHEVVEQTVAKSKVG